MAHVSSHLKIEGKITHTKTNKKKEAVQVTILPLSKHDIWNATEMCISNSETQ